MLCAALSESSPLNKTNVFVTPISYPLRGSQLAVLAAIALLCLGATNAAFAFDFAEVIKRAEQLAAAAYQKPGSNLPKELQALSYDQYWSIRIKPDRTYWRGAKLPFELGFFPEGMYYDQPVRINEVASDGVHEIKFDPDLFEYGASKIDPSALRGLGFAGFGVRYAINNPDVKDEVLIFLGASYLRALGKGQVYGAYARGLAVDTGLGSGEEFPRFIEFWVERPGSAARELIIHALLDSPRVTGAYRFVVRPSVETAIEVSARLYLREAVGKFGVAPLASMFFFGKNQHPAGDDYRPQVHNSDGLSVLSGSGEWIWRPLANPKRLLVSSFALTNPLGFGLMQRDRDFHQYEDLEARYDLRPSVWVEPKGQWGSGRVELVQIPVPDETNSNIVAYWLPDKLPQPKEPFDVEYRLLWQREPDARPAHAWVAQTRRGRGYVRNPDNSIGFVVDVEGPALKRLPMDAKVEASVSVDSNGELLQHSAYRNDVTGGWRIALRVRRIDDGKPVELRGYLHSGNNLLSETWSYLLPPG
jgi:periplasmic glucans biosynthesis protein